MRRFRSAIVGIVVGGSLATTYPALAQKKYDTGATDTEVKFGQTMPYSGPVSNFSAIGKAEVAYFAMINDKGGINGRKINLISLDDGFSPPKALQQTRRLVEELGVLAIVSTVGSPQNLAIQNYLTEQKVPQLFAGSAGSRWGDYKHFPGSIGWQPSATVEATTYVNYVLSQNPNPKIGVLYANDDGGRDYYNATRMALGDRADKLIVAARSYKSSDPSVDAQVLGLKAADADVFLNFGTPKFAAQAIRKAYDIDWHPLQVVYNASISITGVLQPAGLEKSVGLISGAYMKDPNDPQWQNDPGVKDYKAWVDKYYKGADPGDSLNVHGYSLAGTLAYVIAQCGDDLTRANLLTQAINIKGLSLPMLIPGIEVSTSPTNYYPIRAQRMQRFDGARWVPFGPIIKVD